MANLKKWWVDKYSLPPNHELFVNASVAELMLDFYEDTLLRKKGILDQIEDADTKTRDALYDELNMINRALGGVEESSDALVDRWEEQLARGEIPDLDEDF